MAPIDRYYGYLTDTKPTATAATSRRQQALFASIALLLLGAEATRLLLGPGPTHWRDSVWATVLCAALVCVGFWPVVGGASFIALAAVAFVDTTPVAAPLLGTYAVAALWIYKGWKWQALTGMCIVAMVEILRTQSPIPTMIGITVGASIAGIVGFSLNTYHRRVLMAETESARFAAEAAKTEAAVREDLARKLHDSVVRDLSRVAHLSHAVGHEARDKGRWELVESLSLSALRRLRQLASITSDGIEEAETLDQVMISCARLLECHDIALRREAPDLVTVHLHPTTHRTLCWAIREAFTNIVKYAAAGSTASTTVSVEEGQLSVLVTNEIAETDPPIGAISGKFGLRELASEVKSQGGSLYCWVVCNQWMFALDLPLTGGGNDDS